MMMKRAHLNTAETYQVVVEEWEVKRERNTNFRLYYAKWNTHLLWHCMARVMLEYILFTYLAGVVMIEGERLFECKASYFGEWILFI